MPTSFFGVPCSSRYENIVKKMVEEQNEKLEKERKGCEEDQKVFIKQLAALQEEIASMKTGQQGCNMTSIGTKVQLSEKVSFSAQNFLKAKKVQMVVDEIEEVRRRDPNRVYF